MIAILVATRSEAQALLGPLSAVKREGIYHYRGTIAGRAAALFLTRPGVASREQVRRFLRLYKTDVVIATGACASLTSELRHLQTVRIRAATNPDKVWISLAHDGLCCASVPHLIASDTEKHLVHDRSGAQILDMETFTLAGIMKEPEFASRRFVALRVVDDLPGDEAWLAKESKWRDLTARRQTGRLSVSETLRFGLWDFVRISFRRYRVARAIRAGVEAALRSGQF